METLFKVLAFISPLVSALLASFLTYQFGIRAKKKDYLYQNRIPTYKEVFAKLFRLKKYCLGKISQNQGNEFSPYFETEGSALEIRTDIANVIDENEMFLTVKSKQQLNNLVGTLSLLCNAEVAMLNEEESTLDSINIYDLTLKGVEECIKGLQEELKLE